MSEINLPEYKETKVVGTTFMAVSMEDTYFIWLEERGEEEANKLWRKAMGKEPIPVLEKQAA